MTEADEKSPAKHIICLFECIIKQQIEDEETNKEQTSMIEL